MTNRLIIVAFLFVFTTFAPFTSSAQWVQTGHMGGVSAFAIRGTNLIAGTYYAGAFLSTDDGTTWNAMNNGLTNLNVYAFAINGANLFAGTLGGVFLSSDTGRSWTAVNAGLTNTSVLSLATSGANLFAGTFGGVYLSSNGGSSWDASGLAQFYIYAFAVRDTNLFAGVSFGVRISTDNGASWNGAGLGNYPIDAFAVSGTSLFAGSFGSVGVFISSDNGGTWNSENNGLTNLNVRELAVSGTSLFAGTDDGVWRRPISEMTGVEEVNSILPATYSLGKNYPNPFNPSTTIQFSLPKASHVTMNIYNILGQKVYQLISQQMIPGTYTTQWDASDFASGVYYYRLEAGSFIETKKLILLR